MKRKSHPMKSFKHLTLVYSSVVFVQTYLPTLITIEEAFKYEKQYLAEYENLMLDYVPNEIKYIQPHNKSIPCKVVTFKNQTEASDTQKFRLAVHCIHAL